MNKILLAILALFFGIACKNQAGKEKGGLPPAEALKTLRVPPGFRIELVASEPLVSDPVAMDLDEKGNIYVVELHGYPLDTTGSGDIRMLTDTDGDGMPDKSTVFAAHLKLPTGIMRWKKGFLVVDVPDILYLEDTDHDGRADTRKVILTGLALTNPQHIANTPLYGLDNWIYLAHMGTVTPNVSLMFSDSGSRIRFAGETGFPELPRNGNGRNIRFRPDSHVLEMCSGQTQYGQSFDNWGHHFGVENADHIFVETIAAKYLGQNPNLLIGDASDHISDHGKACKVFPITTNPENQLLTDIGVITSACGITWYNGGLFPDSFQNVSFVAEPQSNLIHADRVIPKGASFLASRVYEGSEFFASTDSWCRPVMMYIGPDGALYVLDYYRQIIEHPEWLSDSVIHSGALYNGHDKGRIYRISPISAPGMKWCSRLELGNESTEQWIRHLQDNNIWWRRNAQRLLMDKADSLTVPQLRKFLDTTSSEVGYLHALWLLDGFHALRPEYINKALPGRYPGLRENAIQIAESHLGEFPDLEETLLALQRDADPRVRFQLLCTLGSVQDQAAGQVKNAILMKDMEDSWVQVAALTSAYGRELQLLKEILPALRTHPSEGRSRFIARCAGTVGKSGRIENIKEVLRMATSTPSKESAWWQTACLQGLIPAFSGEQQAPAGFGPEQTALLQLFAKSTEPALRRQAMELLTVIGLPENDTRRKVLATAASVAGDEKENAEYRADAFRLLGLDNAEDHTRLFETAIQESANTQELVQAVLLAFNRRSPAACCESIIHNWKWLGNAARETAMQVFLSSTVNARILLEAIQNKLILPSAISWPNMVELMNNDDAFIRNHSRELLTSAGESREEVVRRYASALNQRGDEARGLVVFKNVCSVCHTVNGKYGHSFGPDLGTVRNRDAGSIMTDILNPNRAIATGYDLCMVTRTNGQKMSGIISSQTPTTLTLTQAGGTSFVMAREDCRTIEILNSSAMPLGLESSVSPAQMADLLAFIKNSR